MTHPFVWRHWTWVTLVGLGEWVTCKCSEMSPVAFSLRRRLVQVSWNHSLTVHTLRGRSATVLNNNDCFHSLGSCQQWRRTVRICPNTTQCHMQDEWNTQNQVEASIVDLRFMGSLLDTERKFMDSKRSCDKLWNVPFCLSIRILLLELRQLEGRGGKGDNIGLRIWN